MDSESGIQSEHLPPPRSEPKASIGQKRSIGEGEETSESSHKRVKMRDLESVFRSETQASREGSNRIHPELNSDSRKINLNLDAISDYDIVHNDNFTECVDESNKLSTCRPEEMDCNDGLTKARGFDLDLNADGSSSSINDLFYPYKNFENLKSRDDSECGSSVGPVGRKDSMQVWKGLKQNNFMSTTHGAVPLPIPKPRVRKKNNNDLMKKKMDLAKKEQVDRFARVAAPSGLLNGLNPGIINHVRNSKQVHSIIEALVKSERSENRHSGIKQGNQIKSGTREFTQRKEMKHVHVSGADISRNINGKILQRKNQSNYLDTDAAREDGDSYVEETRTFIKMPSQYKFENENDGLELKLSSSVAAASENASCLSNEEQANVSSVNSLSVKAANVASQWLELLNQDIRGRLAALRRSKKRVRAVIGTDLPFLISREFSCNQEKSTVDAHSVRWNTLFGQMDKALSEEESHLESWLNQVKEMQLHCEKGLYKSSLYHATQHIGSTANNNRLDSLEKDLDVKAAAASIYSTCNFLLSMENLP